MSSTTSRTSSLRPTRSHRACRVSPSREIHDDEEAPVLGDVVVEYADRSGVSDAVRRIAFGSETSPDVGVDTELSMKDLHGHTVGVAQVSRRVDASRATDPEQVVETIFATENRARVCGGRQHMVSCPGAPGRAIGSISAMTERV
jgi:hypothetical protein